MRIRRTSSQPNLVHIIEYRSHSEPGSQKGHTICDIFHRIVQTLPFMSAWSRSNRFYSDEEVEGLKKKNGCAIDLRGPDMKFEEVYGSKTFRETRGLVMLDKNKDIKEGSWASRKNK